MMTVTDASMATISSRSKALPAPLSVPKMTRKKRRCSGVSARLPWVDTPVSEGVLVAFE